MTRSETDQLIVNELLETAEKLANIAALVARSTVERVEECDRLHDEIERAHHRWWHRPLGLRWEMTGWSWRADRRPL